MAKNTRKKKKDAPVEVVPAIWPVTLMGLVFFLVEIVFLPGAASSFRLPKEAMAVSGILLVVAMALVVSLRRGPWAIPRGSLVAVLVTLPVFHLVSVLWAADSNRALTSAAVSAVWVIAAVWMAMLEPEHRRRITVLTSFGAAISGLVLIFQAAGVPLLVVGRSAGSRFRMSGLAGNPADFATAAVLLLPLLLIAAGKDRRSWWRWLVIGILVLAAGLSQTLTGYLALAALGFVWLVQRRSLKLWAAAVGIGILVFALALAVGFGDRIRRQVRLLELGDWYSVTSARGDGWTAAAEMIRQRPFTGVGARNFTHAYYPNRIAWLEQRGEIGRRGESATHFEWAHCDPLQMVAEFGVFGVFWMAAFSWILFRNRPRGDPLIPMATAATLPFLLLHYPTHLAVGMVPLVLVLGHVLASQPRWERAELRGLWRALVPLMLIAVALAASTWQLRRIAVDIWVGHLVRAVEASAAVPDHVRRTQLASAVEWQIMERIERLPAAEPQLWRVVGKARLARGDARAAEEAFRNANALWPHEEAELGLGLALAAQDRRSEAMVLLGRVCRTNPALTRQIEDPDLRRALEDLNRARRQSHSR